MAGARHRPHGPGLVVFDHPDPAHQVAPDLDRRRADITQELWDVCRFQKGLVAPTERHQCALGPVQPLVGRLQLSGPFRNADLQLVTRLADVVLCLHTIGHVQDETDQIRRATDLCSTGGDQRIANALGPFEAELDLASPGLHRLAYRRSGDRAILLEHQRERVGSRDPTRVESGELFSGGVPPDQTPVAVRREEQPRCGADHRVGELLLLVQHGLGGPAGGIVPERRQTPGDGSIGVRDRRERVGEVAAAGSESDRHRPAHLGVLSRGGEPGSLELVEQLVALDQVRMRPPVQVVERETGHSQRRITRVHVPAFSVEEEQQVRSRSQDDVEKGRLPLRSSSQVSETVLPLALPTDVTGDRGRADHAAVRAVDRGQSEGHEQDAPVLVTALHLHMLDPLPAQEPREVVLRLFRVGVAGQDRDVLAHHIVGSASVQALRAGVPARDVPVGPDRVDSVVGGLDHCGQVLGTGSGNRFQAGSLERR